MTAEGTAVDRIRAALRLLGDEHITTVERRQIEQVLAEIESRTQGAAEFPVTIGYPTLDEWRRRFNRLGPSVRRALYEQALLACPACAGRGVPISWAVVAVEETLEGMTELSSGS